jgi:23S rRNA (guanosine2251-2'-O)-methyltransferase
MKPGKARKDRPKGAKSFSRGSNKRVERSAVARPEKRDNRRDEKSDARKGFRKAARSNEREVKREDRRPDRPEKRFDRRGSTQDAVAGKNSVVEALRAKEIPRRALDDLTGFSNHQGIALVIKPFNYTEFSKLLANAKKPMMLIGLDSITDPHNLGAVVRSAAAFGADGVVIPERRNAAMTGSAWKASAGAAARLPISQVTNLVRSIEDAKKAGCFVIGLDAEGDTTLAKMNLATESIFIVVGSEGKGLSRLVREKCDLVVSIPMQSSVESLNASVATAIVMYQVAAERSK